MRQTPRFTRVAVLVSCLLVAACASTPERGRSEKEKLAMKYFHLAELKFSQGRNLEAIGDLKEALKLDPKNADAHAYLGVVYLLLSEHQQAESELKRALELNPYLTDARNSLGVVYMETGRPEEARGIFEEALKDKTFPNREKILYNLGSLQLDGGQTQAALDSFRKAVTANPTYVKAHLGLARALIQSGRRDDARMHFEKVIELAPDSPEAGQAREYLEQLADQRKG